MTEWLRRKTNIKTNIKRDTKEGMDYVQIVVKLYIVICLQLRIICVQVVLIISIFQAKYIDLLINKEDRVFLII